MKDCSIKETADILQKSNHIALVAHINPDGDAVGSLLGLGNALSKMSKRVYMFIDDDIPEQFAFLTNIGQIQRFAFAEPLPVDLLVVLDSSDFDRVGKAKEKVNFTQSLNIDHHISNEGFTDFRCLDVKAAATCEMIVALLDELAVEIDEEIAQALYLGIVTDCGFFRYANTTSKTMHVAAKLLDYGVVPNEIADYIETQTVETVMILPKVLETMEFYLDNKVASISVSPDLYREGVDSDIYVKYPRYISGVQVALLFKGVSDEVTRISMRSKSLDVSKIATLFDGGGHKLAAGCTIQGDIKTAKELIVKALAEHMREDS